MATHALAADITGAWTATSAKRDGSSAPELVGHRLELDAGTFRITHANTLLFGGSYTMRLEQVPREIDFVIENGPGKGQKWAGIFKTHDGVLTICDNAPDPSAPRPRDFAAAKGSRHVCLEFGR